MFEGPDGVGKSELSRRCVQHLQDQGHCCELLAFPGQEDGTLGKLVYDIHHGPARHGVSGMSPTSLQILHIAAHVDAIDRRILPALQAGNIVVLDRFWWSTWVYGTVAGAQPPVLQAMLQLELAAWGQVRPDIVLLIRRKKPLRPEPPKQWQAWLAEYGNLATSESSKYPVTEVANESTIQAALDKIIGVVGGLTAPPFAERAPDRRHRSSSGANGPPSPATSPIVFSKLTPAKPTVVYDTYWRFAAERQRIFHKRAAGEAPPWTSDSILREFKFTNAYRASDRVSQYLIHEVIYRGDQSPDEVFFRTMLFKLFNRIDTWELLCRNLGAVRYSEYKFDRYDAVLTRAMEGGVRIYSAAYIMPSGGSVFGFDRKHRTHLKLVESMMGDELPQRLMGARSMRQAFELLRSYPTIGDFLAYQYITDLNYSTLTDFSEMDFVVPGPGARDGIRKCFTDLGGLTESDLIRVVANRQQAEFDRLGLRFQSLWGRPLQLIDCQNLFCETDKYSRAKHPEIQGLTGRTRIKQKFQPTAEPITYWYPPKWGLNAHIKPGRAHDPTLLWEQR